MLTLLTRSKPVKPKQMWRDNLTQAEYTQADYDQMKANPVYKNLVARLVELPSAPDPLDALPHQAENETVNENRIFDSAVDKDNGAKGGRSGRTAKG
mgnify:CR=1 FL=1